MVNIDKCRVAANITKYHNNLPKNHFFNIFDNKAIISCEMLKINIFKMDARTF